MSQEVISSKVNTLSKPTFAIIQARMNSSRLPAKSMLKLGDWTIIEWVIMRVLSIIPKERVFLATSKAPDNKKLIEIAKKLEINFLEGEENDVLSRFVCIGKSVGFDNNFLRVCADNPFVSPTFIATMVKKAQKLEFDLIDSNRTPINPNIVDGFGSELISGQLLRNLGIMHSQITEYDREHVTSYVHSNSKRFRIETIQLSKDYSRGDLDLDVDSLDDFKKVCEIVRIGALEPNSQDIEIINSADEYNRTMI